MLSELVRQPQGAVAGRLSAFGEQAVCTNIVVSAELRYVAAKSGSQRLRRRADALLSALKVLPLEPPADLYYATIRAQLARRGIPIGPNDLLIAAHAKCLGLVLVTADEDEFRRVPGLAVENWLR